MLSEEDESNQDLKAQLEHEEAKMQEALEKAAEQDAKANDLYTNKAFLQFQLMQEEKRSNQKFFFDFSE